MTIATLSPRLPGPGREAPAYVRHPVPGQLVQIVGVVDAACVAEVRMALHEAVDNGLGDLVVDVSGLELGDATCLGALLGAHRRAMRVGRTLVLDGVPSTLHRVLTYTRLIRVLAVRGQAAASA